jgi:L-ascorbate metabolism protein UlaG (beta-lactamase superfamily)
MIEPFKRDDALLAEIASTPRDESRLDLWWLGQSGFLVQHNRTRVVFDPYLSDSLTRKYEGTDKPHVRMSRRVIDPSRLTQINLVTSTHGHTDHLDAETLDPLLEANPSARLIYAASTQKLVLERIVVPNGLEPLDAGQRIEFAGAWFNAVPAAHDCIERDEHGRHKYLGYVVQLGPFTIYHSGDGIVYDGLADSVAALGAIDLAILPINGKVGNMGGIEAARLAKAIGARLVVPCHYDLFTFNTADPNDAFVPECERIRQPYRVMRLGERITLERES